MSLENVQAFYQRLATDETFRTQLQQVNSKDECNESWEEDDSSVLMVHN